MIGSISSLKYCNVISGVCMVDNNTLLILGMDVSSIVTCDFASGPKPS